MNQVKTKILLADDHSMIRNGIIRLLSNNIQGAEYTEASNGAEVLQCVLKSKYNLIILDISMPGRDGLDVLKEINEVQPGTPIAIFTMYPEEQFAIRSIKCGAATYLSKDMPSAELVTAIKKVLKGEHYFTPKLMELISKDLRSGQSRPAHQLLSDREFQVFLMIASGKSVSQIAIELSLSVKTISVYRANVLRKMNLKHNSEITHYAFKNKLVG
jgi:DNA-binding NarL/FixJ family response regulator